MHVCIPTPPSPHNHPQIIQLWLLSLFPNYQQCKLVWHTSKVPNGKQILFESVSAHLSLQKQGAWILPNDSATPPPPTPPPRCTNTEIMILMTLQPSPPHPRCTNTEIMILPNDSATPPPPQPPMHQHWNNVAHIAASLNADSFWWQQCSHIQFSFSLLQPSRIFGPFLSVPPHKQVCARY